MAQVVVSLVDGPPVTKGRQWRLTDYTQRDAVLAAFGVAFRRPTKPGARS
jgi:hypothetical protein